MTTPRTARGRRRLTLQEIAQAKREGRPLVMVTAYDYPSGRIAERAGRRSRARRRLGGDGRARPLLDGPGHDRRDAHADGRGGARCRRPLVIADLPFMSYQVSDEDALRAAGRFLKEAARRGREARGRRADAGAHPRDRGRGHPGRRPPRADAADGDLAGRLPRAGRRRPQAALRLLHDAHAAEAAGAFLLVLEAVPAPVAARISASSRSRRSASAPGAGCDGQVLVFHDLLGLGEGPLPRFVEQYATLGDQAVEAVARYADDVRKRRFPQERHTYAISDDELEHFQRLVEAGSPLGAEDEGGVL